ncbi:MAG: class B sortase [Oscillospiraceae bacterium]|nr:class B sortase [Oscillospiraceae bacterium]
MDNNKLPTAQHSGKKGGKFFPALCNILGTLILLLVIAVCLPLTLPRMLGYDVYNVVSGSMAPAIPEGSVVYVQEADPVEIEPGDVIAFWDGATVVTHRVAENHVVMGEFVTKGDANDTEDISPVPYNALIGHVKRHFPVVGQFLSLLASGVGKAYLLCLAACGVMFNILAGRLREHHRVRLDEAEAQLLRDLPLPGREQAEEPAAPAPAQDAQPPRRKKKKTLRTVLMFVFLGVFIAAGSVVAVVKHQYAVSERLYSSAAAQFTAQAAAAPVAVPAAPQEEEERTEERLPVAAPIVVNFDALREVSPDIVGWIFCPDTVINYPVVQGTDDSFYLSHSYDGSANVSGSIFVEGQNGRDFVDSNSILYGHHMNDNSMFATLDRWQNQSYFDAHPVMWLLTPEQDYQIQLFSSYTTSAYSETYQVFREPSLDFTEYVKIAALYSEVQTGVELDPDSRYVLLSTCAYVFDSSRSVVHGRLMPVSTAGGLAIAD